MLVLAAVGLFALIAVMFVAIGDWCGRLFAFARGEAPPPG